MAQTDWFAANAPKSPAPPPTPHQASDGGDWFAANAPKSSQSTPQMGDAFSMHDLASSNPNDEGLYHMKDDDGHSYGIPFSSVEIVPDFKNSFVDEKEAERYEKDMRASKPSEWAKLRTKVYDLTEPTLEYQNGPKNLVGGSAAMAEMQTNVLKRVGRTLFGIADMTPQLYQSVKKMASSDPKVSQEGEQELLNFSPGGQVAERVKEFKRDYKKDPDLAFANSAGDALAFMLADKLGEAAKDLPESYRNMRSNTLRRLVGTDERATEDLVRDINTKNKKIALKAEEEGRPEHAKMAQKIIEQNEKDEAAHNEKVKEIQKENDEKQKAYGDAVDARNKTEVNRIKLNRKLAELKSRIFPKDAPSRVKTIQNAAKAYFNKQYDTLAKLVGDKTASLNDVTNLLDEAEGKIQGSDTRVQVFQDIRNRAKGEIPSVPKPDDWNSMSPDEQDEWRNQVSAKGAKITYDDLRGYSRELGKLLGSDSTPGDVKAAAGFMRDGLENIQGKLAEEAGPQAKSLHDKLKNEYRDYAETMLDRTSPVTKMLNAKDADSALKVFEGMSPFQKSYALNLLKGTGEHSDWLRRTDPAELGEGGEHINTPAETRAENLVKSASEKLAKAKNDLENPPPKAQPGWEEGARKAVDRAKEELSKAKEEAVSLKRPSKLKLRNMRNYRTETANLVRDYLDSNQELDTLGNPKKPPKPPTLKEIPVFEPKEVPEFEPPKAEGISKEKLELEKETAVNDYLAKLRKNRIKIGLSGFGTIGLSEVLGHAFDHFFGMGGGTTEAIGLSLAAAQMTVPSLLIKILKMPGVAESLKFITESESRMIESMDPTKRFVTDKAIISLTQLAKSEGYIKPGDPTPMANFAKKDMPKAKEEAAKAETKKDEEPPEEPPATPEPAPEPPPAPPVAPQAAAEPEPAPEAQPEPVASPAPQQPVVTPVEESIPSRRLEDLNVDAKRFQYKLGGNKHGVTDALSDAKWDQRLADPIHIWQDPETGEEFVVNGHHRYELAKQAGAERINVAPIDNKEVKTAAEAREFGAMKNIADGNGTSVDAAKFFRENGLSPADLKSRGLSLKKSVANEGVALSRLSDDLFHRVVDGNLDPKVGAAIGDASENPTDQEAIWKDVQRREKQGRPVSAEQIRESARLIKQSPTYTSQTEDLFGNHEEERNLFLEMGEVSEYIQKELADEKRMFGRISTKGASEQLAKGENVINAKRNAEISQRAAQLRERYMKRSTQSGAVHAALEEAAQRLAEGGKPNAIKQDAFDEIRRELEDELPPLE